MFEHLSDHTKISELQSPSPGRNVALNILQSKVIKMSLGLKGALLNSSLRSGTVWECFGVGQSSLSPLVINLDKQLQEA